MKKLLILSMLIACDTKGTKADDVKREVKQAVDTTAQYAKDSVTETRDEAIKATEAQLKAIDAKIEELKADLAKRNTQAKAAAERSLADLEEKRKEIAADLEQMKKDAGDGWKETRRKVNAVSNAFDASFKDLKDRLSKI